MSEKSEPFFRINPEQYDSLRLEVQTVSPELQSKCDEISRIVCEAFIKQFGQYLNSEQTKFLRDIPVMAVSEESIKKIAGHWEEKNVVAEAKLLNDLLYKSYSMTADGNNNDQTSDDGRGRQFWSGRLAASTLFKYDDGSIVPVDKKFLMSKQEYEEYSDSLSLKEAFAQIRNFLATIQWAQIALHEKIHSIMDPQLPLPICESAAEGYQKTLFQIENWDSIDSPTRKSGAYWQQLIKEIGPDLNLYAFGNLNDEKRKAEIEAALEKAFTPDKIEEVFPDVIWKTKKAELDSE